MYAAHLIKLNNKLLNFYINLPGHTPKDSVYDTKRSFSPKILLKLFYVVVSVVVVVTVVVAAAAVLSTIGTRPEI